MAHASRVMGPAVAAVVLAVTSPGVCFLLNALSFLPVIYAMFAMHPDELFQPEPVARAKGQIREGFRYIARTPALRSALLIILTVGSLAFEFTVTFPLAAKLTFHGTVNTYSWMNILMGIGAVGGGLAIAGRLRATGRVLVGFAVGVGFVLLGLALAPNLPVFLVMCVAAGVGQPLVMATGSSFVQLTADPAMRGRVVSIYLMCLFGGIPIGGPIIGWVCQEWGPRAGLAVGGVASILGALAFGTVFLTRRSPGRGREVEEPAWTA